MQQSSFRFPSMLRGRAAARITPLACLVVLALGLANPPASGQAPPADCSVFAGPPSTPVHLGTFAGGSSIVNRYQTTVVLNPNPAAANQAALLANGYWIHVFTPAQVSSGGAITVTFDLPCYTIQCGDTFFPAGTTVVLKCWMGSYCSGQTCGLQGEPFTIPSLIVEQPGSKSVCSGSATFSVTVAAPPGLPPATPFYQWYTVAPSPPGSIAGATGPTYTTSVPGWYSVHVGYGTNCGEWSNTVSLTTGSNPAASFGSGVPGSGGFVPTLQPSGCGAAGKTFSIEVANGLGGAAGLALVGFAGTPEPHPAAFCGSLLVLPQIVSPLVLGGPAGAAGAGTGSLPLAVPAGPSFAGIDVYFQYGALDPAACQGVSISKGLLLTLN